MRKSGHVQAALLAVTAATLLYGCRSPQQEVRNCVDAQGHIVPDTNCSAHTGSGGYAYRYGGSSGGRTGDTVYGGSGHPASEESGHVSRGGFGEGEGGAHGE